jgi:hypothetical protein
LHRYEPERGLWVNRARDQVQFKHHTCNSGAGRFWWDAIGIRSSWR